MRVTKQPSEEIEGRRPERKTGRLDPVRKEEEEEGGESQTENFLNILNFSFPPSPLITLGGGKGGSRQSLGCADFLLSLRAWPGCALQREKRDSSFRNFSATFRTFSPLRHFFPAIFFFFSFFFFFPFADRPDLLASAATSWRPVKISAPSKLMFWHMGNLVVVFLRVFLVIWRSVIPLGRRSANTPGQRPRSRCRT